ncbi:MAG: malonic semialdehyde reductase [Candidatus Sphingomonas phytovorans]|nr:malonic semialdehyde reductase [Sphingomonas sp.]WEK02304.1 MAG: malonic semialdehyde reductase [Sphingomonas sp.]
MNRNLPDDALDILFREARSYNAYYAEPVAEADIKAIWELAKMGPTSANQLPARLVWVTSSEGRERLAKVVSDKNRPKVLGAPVSVIIGMDVDFHLHLPDLFPHLDAKSWFEHDAELRFSSAFRNSSLQGAYLIIAARALGFDTGPISGFDHEGVEAAFFSDTPNVRVNFIMTLGHGDPSSVFGRLPRPEFERFNRIA